MAGVTAMGMLVRTAKRVAVGAGILWVATRMKTAPAPKPMAATKVSTIASASGPLLEGSVAAVAQPRAWS